MKKIEQFDKYMLFKGLNDNKVTEALGLSRGLLGKSRKDNRDLSDKVVEKILAFYTDLNKVWLLTGEGDMLLGDVEDCSTKEDTKPRIPANVFAGAFSGIADATRKEDCEQLQVIKRFPDYDCTIIVRGDSMEPKFEAGDEIAIKRVDEVIEEGIVYVLDTKDGAVLKRIYDEGDKFKCVSFNKEYPDFTVSKDNVNDIFRVVGLIRI